MADPTVLVATWRDGLFVVSGETTRHELAGQPVRALARDGRGGALAVVNRHSLCRRAADGDWSTITTNDTELACPLSVGDLVFVGTDDARILRVSASGATEQLTGFAAVAGQDKWYAGSAVINGQVVGPPLGMSADAGRNWSLRADGLPPASSVLIV